MPDQPTSYHEWKRQPLLPPTPRADIDTTIWPSETICTAWCPLLEVAAPLGTRIYADDTNHTSVVTSARNAGFVPRHSHHELRR
eukprot:7941882-Pyramimonas_sp.AAC.1